MNSSAIRLLAIDIDGTLLDPQFRISAANLAALQRAHAAHVEIVLATGRRHLFAMPIAERLGFDHWLISSNGAMTRSTRGELFHSEFLPRHTALQLCRHMTAFRGSTVLTFDRESSGALVVERLEDMADGMRPWLEKNRQHVSIVRPLEHALVEDPIQAMFGGAVAPMRQAVARLDEADFRDQVTVLRTEYEARDLSIVDVLKHGTSKGHALRRLAQERGFSPEEIMAIGDNYNDLDMLQAAGHPVIMGNACRELLEMGFALTRSNAQDGVALAVDSMLQGSFLPPLAAE